MKFPFTKMHGLGNDFIVIDKVTNLIDLKKINIKEISKRNTGIGFDQLLVLEKSSHNDVDFKYRIFNADGNEVEQCGNGARCIALYLIEKKLTKKKQILIETVKGLIELNFVSPLNISVNMGKPIFKPDQIPILADQQKLTYIVDGINVGILSMGNPHAILLYKNIEKMNIALIAKKIQSSSFFPKGVNVSFLEIHSKDKVSLRVYERGVGETLACGSAACAAVVYGVEKKLLNKSVKVFLKGGNLKIDYQNNSEVLMTGPARLVFDGFFLE